MVKNWLLAAKSRTAFEWDLRISVYTMNASILPGYVKDLITLIPIRLEERCLATKNYSSHITNGPVNPVLLTCPEIWDNLMSRSTGVGTEILDEYLEFLINGLSIAAAKLRLVDLANRNYKRIDYSLLSFVAKENNVPIDSLWRWIQELESCDFLRIDGNEMERLLQGSGFSTYDPIIARAVHTMPWSDVGDVIRDFFKDAKENMSKWFDSGEENFQRFDVPLSKGLLSGSVKL